MHKIRTFAAMPLIALFCRRMRKHSRLALLERQRASSETCLECGSRELSPPSAPRRFLQRLAARLFRRQHRTRQPGAGDSAETILVAGISEPSRRRCDRLLVSRLPEWPNCSRSGRIRQLPLPAHLRPTPAAARSLFRTVADAIVASRNSGAASATPCESRRPIPSTRSSSLASRHVNAHA